jgi:hypothetical protein
VSWQFGRIFLPSTGYAQQVNGVVLDPVPVKEVLRVYREYCLHRHFQSVIPMVPGRLTASDTEVIGYHDAAGKLIAWSMYRIWDSESILSDHFAWDYRDPRLRLGIRSIENECAIYRDRGYRWMYFESVEPYMLDLEGFEIMGPMQ